MKAAEACKQCKTAGLGSSSSEHSYLTALKESVRDGKYLHHPSDSVLSMLKCCEELFRGIIIWMDSILTLKSPLQAVTTCLSKMPRRNLQTCEQHKEAVEKIATASYTRLRLRIHLRRQKGSGQQYKQDMHRSEFAVKFLYFLLSIIKRKLESALC